MDFENVLDKSLVGSEPDEWFNVTTVSYYIDDVLNNVLIIKSVSVFATQFRRTYRYKPVTTSPLIFLDHAYHVVGMIKED